MIAQTPPAETTGLILVLGDQLSPNISSLRAANRATDVILIAEVSDEASYVPHHRKKIAFLFSAMRHHAEALRTAGWNVRYVRLNDPQNTGSICGEVERAARDLQAQTVTVNRRMAASADRSDPRSGTFWDTSTKFK
jgi:deoxyribodipyrimidine photolyase-related protein